MTTDGAGPRSGDVPPSPILNGPYDVPTRYYEMGPNGRTDRALD